MVTGDKPAARHPGAVDAKSPGVMAWLLGAVVVGATGYLIVQYDRDAFALRSAESFEQGAGPHRAITEPEYQEDGDD